MAQKRILHTRLSAHDQGALHLCMLHVAQRSTMCFCTGKSHVHLCVFDLSMVWTRLVDASPFSMYRSGALCRAPQAYEMLSSDRHMCVYGSFRSYLDGLC